MYVFGREGGGGERGEEGFRVFVRGGQRWVCLFVLESVRVTSGGSGGLGAWMITVKRAEEGWLVEYLISE